MSLRGSKAKRTTSFGSGEVTRSFTSAKNALRKRKQTSPSQESPPSPLPDRPLPLLLNPPPLLPPPPPPPPPTWRARCGKWSVFMTSRRRTIPWSSRNPHTIFGIPSKNDCAQNLSPWKRKNYFSISLCVFVCLALCVCVCVGVCRCVCRCV